MTRSSTPTLEQAKGRLRDMLPWIWLVEVEVPTSPPTRYRFASNLEPVNFGVNSDGDPLTYSPFPIHVGEVRQTAEGDIPTIDVTVYNAERVVGFAVDEYDGLIGQPVKIILVSVSDLSNPASRIEERAEIQGVTVSAEAVTFTLSAYSLYRAQLPAFRHVSRSCRWQYGSAPCGYQLVAGATESVGGGFSTCPKTVEACEERGADELARGATVLHPQRFGGFPGIPRQSGSV